MVKSNICPVCLADIPGEYIEEGDLRIADEAISCPNCGFILEGVMDECPELEELDKGKRIKGVGLNNLKVNCYSGHIYAERPISFLWQCVEYEVEEIEKEWQEPGERHFQVKTKDNKLFQLCYNGVKDQWSLIELVRG